MIEANLNLQPLWPSNQSHKQVYCLHRLERPVQFQEKQLFTYLATLGATSSVAEFDKACTEFEEKPAVHLPRYRRTLGTAFISYRVWERSVHNSKKKQLYTYI